MDNQQVSYTEETFIQHPTLTRLEIGCFGTIRDFKTKINRYYSLNKLGYYTLNYKISGHINSFRVHRLVAEMFLPEPPQELKDKCAGEHHGKVIVKHKDNNKLNNRYDNLEYSDHKGNTQQAWDDGLIPSLKGELNGRAVLTEDLVHTLCKAFQDGMKPKEACRVYGVSRQQATKIRAGHAWTHISSQYNIKVNKRVKTSTISRKDVGASAPEMGRTVLLS